MAGVDNSDDSDVRNQIKAHPKQGAHRAHRHYPNWKEIKVIRGQDWPIAAKGIHLTAPPATPEDFWALCMACLNDTLTELGLEMPTEPDLWENHISEKDFREMQRILRQGPESEPAL
jgi:hypothetical protein